MTCQKNKEGKCVHEMRDWLTDLAEHLYPEALEAKAPDAANEDAGEEEVDIEKAIAAEVKDIRKPAAAQLFTPVRLDMQCGEYWQSSVPDVMLMPSVVVFFKTIAPVEPVSLVKTICEEAMADNQCKRTRFTKRLSPMTLMGRASAEGLEKVATEVLAPHFHQEPFQRRKVRGCGPIVSSEDFASAGSNTSIQFAIRPTLRNHNILSRDAVIKQVASIVGPGHVVDLQHYELLIVVEVYQVRWLNLTSHTLAIPRTIVLSIDAD